MLEFEKVFISKFNGLYRYDIYFFNYKELKKEKLSLPGEDLSLKHLQFLLKGKIKIYRANDKISYIAREYSLSSSKSHTNFLAISDMKKENIKVVHLKGDVIKIEGIL